MPYQIMSAWRMQIIALFLLLFLVLFERIRSQRLPKVIWALVWIQLGIALVSSGFEMIPYYFWGYLLPQSLRLFKLILVTVVLGVLLLKYVVLLVKYKNERSVE